MSSSQLTFIFFRGVAKNHQPAMFPVSFLQDSHNSHTRLFHGHVENTLLPSRAHEPVEPSRLRRWTWTPCCTYWHLSWNQTRWSWCGDFTSLGDCMVTIAEKRSFQSSRESQVQLESWRVLLSEIWLWLGPRNIWGLTMVDHQKRLYSPIGEFMIYLIVRSILLLFRMRVCVSMRWDRLGELGVCLSMSARRAVTATWIALTMVISCVSIGRLFGVLQPPARKPVLWLPVASFHRPLLPRLAMRILMVLACGLIVVRSGPLSTCVGRALGALWSWIFRRDRVSFSLPGLVGRCLRRMMSPVFTHGWFMSFVAFGSNGIAIDPVFVALRV